MQRIETAALKAAEPISVKSVKSRRPVLRNSCQVLKRKAGA
jgi:hypothetical protein